MAAELSGSPYRLSRVDSFSVYLFASLQASAPCSAQFTPELRPLRVSDAKFAVDDAGAGGGNLLQHAKPRTFGGVVPAGFDREFELRFVTDQQAPAVGKFMRPQQRRSRDDVMEIRRAPLGQFFKFGLRVQLPRRGL